MIDVFGCPPPSGRGIYGTIASVLPLPPIIVNVPPPSGPPWWATALIGLASAIVAVIATAYLSRNREHSKWLWEKQMEFYFEILTLVRDVERACVDTRFRWQDLECIDKEALRQNATALTDIRLYISELSSAELRKQVMLTAEYLLLVYRAAREETQDIASAQYLITRTLNATEAVRAEVDRSIREPPHFGYFRSRPRADRRSARSEPLVDARDRLYDP